MEIARFYVLVAPDIKVELLSTRKLTYDFHLTFEFGGIGFVIKHGTTKRIITAIKLAGTYGYVIIIQKFWNIFIKTLSILILLPKYLTFVLVAKWARLASFLSCIMMIQFIIFFDKVHCGRDGK